MEYQLSGTRETEELEIKSGASPPASQWTNTHSRGPTNLVLDRVTVFAQEERVECQSLARVRHVGDAPSLLRLHAS